MRLPSLIGNRHRRFEAPESGGERSSSVAEQMIEANGVELCTEAFGDPADPPILLITGIGASMLWWEERLCRLLAGAGRFVIRYDHRNTGRSITYEPGQPEPPGDRDLPPPKTEFGRFVATAEADWSNPDSVVDYLVDHSRILAGGERAFDETRVRELVRRDVERARDFAAVQNTSSCPTARDHPSPCLRSLRRRSSSTAPPIRCSRSHTRRRWRRRSPGARLLCLGGGGHGVDRGDWAPVARDDRRTHHCERPTQR
jgi:hypothetical protein